MMSDRRGAAGPGSLDPIQDRHVHIHDHEVEAVFRAYDWPGNVRQLQNVVRNVVVLHDGPLVEPSMLPEPLKSRARDGVTALPAPAVRIDPAESERRGASIRPLWLVEKEVIQEALRQCEDDVPKAATLLEISPSTIYRKLQQWKAEGAGKR